MRHDAHDPEVAAALERIHRGADALIAAAHLHGAYLPQHHNEGVAGIAAQLHDLHHRNEHLAHLGARIHEVQARRHQLALLRQQQADRHEMIRAAQEARQVRQAEMDNLRARMEERHRRYAERYAERYGRR